MNENLVKKIKSWESFESFDGLDFNYIADCDFGKPSLLQEAVRRDDIEVISFLMKKNVDVNYINPGNNNALLYLNEDSKNHLEITKLLVSNGININYVGKYKIYDDEFYYSTALSTAAMNGWYETVIYLLEQGVEVNVKEFDGSENNMPTIAWLDYNDNSSHELYEKCIDLMLESGADINSYGAYVVFKCLQNGNFALAKKYLNIGKKVNQNIPDESHENKTLFMYLLEDDEFDISVEDEVNLFDEFINFSGEDINVRDIKGRSLLFYSIDTSIVDDDFFVHATSKLIIEKNIDVNLKDGNGRTILHYLFGAEADEIDDFEVDDGEFNYFFEDGIDDRYKYILELLIIAGIDLNIKHNGNTAYDYANYNDYSEVLEILDNNENILNADSINGMSHLFIASAQGEVKKVEWLLKKGAYPNLKCKCNIRNHSMDIYGINWDLGNEVVESKMMTALMVAENLEIVKILLKTGADVNIKSSSGSTALMQFVSKNWYEGAHELIKSGADCDLINNKFMTAFDIYQYQISKGLKPNSKLYKLLEESTKRDWKNIILIKIFNIFK